MKYFLASICISMSLGIAPNLALANTSDTGQLTSLNDISLLAQRGLSDETILIFLEKRSLGFNLTAENIDQLLQSGVSEDVVQYLLQQQTSQPVYVTTPVATYINPYPTYYYSPQYNHVSTSAPLLHGFAAASYTFGHHETFQPHYGNSISHNSALSIHHSQRPQHSSAVVIHNSGLSLEHNNRHNNVSHSSGGHNLSNRRSHSNAGHSSQTHSRGGHSNNGHSNSGGGHRGGGGHGSGGGHRGGGH